MKAKPELPRTPLALAVMNLLMERPMHPYEMKLTMKERGHDEITGWLAELLTQPVNEYPQFGGALAFVAALDKDDVTRLLKTRIALLDAQIAGAEKQLKNFLGMGLPRLFLVEGEYAVAMQRAELEWVRRIVDDIQSGKLWITKEQMKAVGDAFESGKEGGDSG